MDPAKPHDAAGDARPGAEAAQSADRPREAAGQERQPSSDGYTRAAGCFAGIIQVLLAFGFFLSIVNLAWARAMLSALLMVAVWGLFEGVRRHVPTAFRISLALATLLWLYLLFVTVRRVGFVLEHGGMERADGYGSPMAFLLGVFFEQLLFLPLCIVVLRGWRRALPRRHLPRIGAA